MAHDTTKWFPWCGMNEDRDRISRVQDDVFLTSWRGAALSTDLKALGVTHIVCCMEEPCEADDGHGPGHAGFETVTLLITDDEQQGMGPAVDTALKFMTGAIADGGRVAVHCAAGISRSTTVVLAFLMRQRSMTLVDAFAHTRAARPVVWPNDGFMRQLAALEVSIHGGEPTIDPEEYVVWGRRDGEAYAAAKVVDRPAAP